MNRTNMILRSSVVLALALSGCASHYALAEPSVRLGGSGLFNDPNQVSRIEKAMTDRDLADLLDAHIRPKLPTSLAVARLQDARSGRYQLVTIDSKEVESWTKLIENVPHLGAVHPVSPLTAGDDTSVTMHSLRTAAARMNCELLLVYLQADSSVNNYNDASVLYWTVIGLWIAPGNTVEHKTVMQAILVDCRTGAVLGTAGGDCYLKKDCPTAFEDIRRRELSDEAPSAALADLQKGCGRLLKRLVESAVGKRN